MKFLFSILIAISICGCKNSNDKEFDPKVFNQLKTYIDKEGQLNLDKIKTEYRKFENQNNFSFIDVNRNLDDEKYDLNCMMLASKLREKGKISGIKTQFNSDSLEVLFNIYSICCSNFYADYKLKNDILAIQLHNISSAACDCMCGYEVKFAVLDKQKKIKFNRISISD